MWVMHCKQMTIRHSRNFLLEGTVLPKDHTPAKPSTYHIFLSKWQSHLMCTQHARWCAHTPDMHTNTHLPNTVCLLSSQLQGTVVMKNWLRAQVHSRQSIMLWMQRAWLIMVTWYTQVLNLIRMRQGRANRVAQLRLKITRLTSTVSNIQLSLSRCLCDFSSRSTMQAFTQQLRLGRESMYRS